MVLNTPNINVLNSSENPVIVYAAKNLVWSGPNDGNSWK